MTFRVSTARSLPARANAVAKLCSSNSKAEAATPAAKAAGFEGKLATTSMIDTDDGVVLLVGTGTASNLNHKAMRKAGAALVKAGQRVAHIAVDASDHGDDDELMQAFVEGMYLGAYTYTEQKSEPKKRKLTRVSVVGLKKRPLDRAAGIGAAVNWARDQVNRPGGTLTPTEFANEAVKLAKANGLKTKVMSKAAIKRARMGGLLGVNRGSSQEPKFVEVSYVPTGRSRGHVALVGKGITFDSGGLSLKSGNGMMTMKCDMGGAAAVLGAMAAIAAVKPKVKVTAYVPMTDNMTGPDATRPGDVLTARNGKTIEVLNTDAEGRLILADALSLASEAKPDAIVDCATLTGACMVALGPDYAGIMGNNEAMVDQVGDAADAIGELVWPLPLPRSYRKLIDSNVADMKNIGGAHGGAITAGLFLNEFVDKDIPWVHIDLAAPAFASTAKGYAPKGGTGFGVRTLTQFVEAFEKL